LAGLPPCQGSAAYGSNIYTGTAIPPAGWIAVFLTVDAARQNWDLSLALARRFAALRNWLAFWRQVGLGLPENRAEVVGKRRSATAPVARTCGSG
jgi:hypothetical protein